MLTANEAHGIRFCPIAIVELDLTGRNIPHVGLSEMEKRRTDWNWCYARKRSGRVWQCTGADE